MGLQSPASLAAPDAANIRDGRHGTVGSEISRADALHDKDQFIRKEERFDAKHDGSHITGAEQKAINQQENGVSGKSP
ncbi:MAG TPA: hypothetical protein VG270_01950 [Pseudolabrys sp.]|nr:hypothetical protein [Pseudolabrys sp.]